MKKLNKKIFYFLILIPILLGVYFFSINIKDQENKKASAKDCNPRFCGHNYQHPYKIDIDGDGKDEIIDYPIEASWWQNVSILKNDSSGELFCKHCTFSYHDAVGEIEFKDVNGDGTKDVELWGGDGDGNKVAVFYFKNGDYTN